MKKRLAIVVVFALCAVVDVSSQAPVKADVPSVCFTPRADAARLRNIRDAKDWKNPYLIVAHDGATLVGGSETPTAIESIPSLLRSLPCSGWPYGRIVAIQESGLRAIGDDAAITKNRLKLKKLLEKNGIEVDQWPSA